MGLMKRGFCSGGEESEWVENRMRSCIDTNVVQHLDQRLSRIVHIRAIYIIPAHCPVLPFLD